MLRAKRLIKSFSYAFQGIKKAFVEEQNLQVQSIIGIIVLILAYFLKISSVELSLIIIVIFLVILMELVNSAVERITDALKPRIHTYVKEIKDIMAGVVMLASVLAVITGLIIFIPYLI